MSSDTDTLIKAQSAAYVGTGDTDSKEKNADKTLEQTKENNIPNVNPGENWKKPISEVYPDFEKWLKVQTETLEKRVSLAQVPMGYYWYKSNSPITILDRDKYKDELFNTKGIQEKYKLYLSGAAGVNGDPIAIKFQSGNIMADERAFYIRHATIARSMANGILSNNKHAFLREVYLTHIKSIRDTCDTHREACHKQIYKNDAEGVNNKKP